MAKDDSQTGGGEGKPGGIMPFVQRMGLRRGLLQGNSRWLALGIATWGLRKLIAMASRDEEVVFLEELKAGQRIVISNGRPTVD